MQQHQIDALFSTLTKDLIRERPTDPIDFMIQRLTDMKKKRETSSADDNDTFRRVVFVLGGPGSGKGTQCDKMVKELGMVHFSAGDLLRAETKKDTETGRMISRMIEEGAIVPGHITIQLLRENILSYPDGKNKWFLVDGFPREMKQALDFEREITPCQFVLFFDCDLDTLEGRLIERGKTSGRTDDNLDAIKKRFATYHRQTMPVIEYYSALDKVRRINATRAIEEVYNEVRSLFEV